MAQADLLDLALAGDERRLGREMFKRLTYEWFTEFDQGRGLGISNKPDAQARVAFELFETGGYSKLQI